MENENEKAEALPALPKVDQLPASDKTGVGRLTMPDGDNFPIFPVEQ